MSVFEKYNLEPAVSADFLSSIHAVLVSLAEKVNAPDPTTEKSEKSDLLASKYDKDEAGQQAARDFLRSDVLDAIVNYIGEDQGRTYHVLNALIDMPVKYLREECAYFRAQGAPKSVGTSAKAEARADYNALRKQFAHFAGIVAAVDSSEIPTDIVKNNGGTFVSVLPGFKGPGVSTDQVHGRYAKVYALAWNIDGEDLPPGTQLSEIVRNLWHGADRIGKNTKDLADLLDCEVPKWADPAMPDTTFVVNGHNVTISRDTED